MPSKRKPVLTPAVLSWGLNRAPFEDFTLRAEHENLFVNRHSELIEVENAIAARLTGICGAQGVGKSSLLRAMASRVENQVTVVYVRAGVSEETVFREMLTGVLHAIKQKRLRLRRGVQVKVAQELWRVKHGIESTWKARFNLELFHPEIKVGPGVERTVKASPHDEHSAFDLLIEVLENATTSVVLIVDDLERISAFLDQEGYLRFMLAMARILDESLRAEGVSVFVSLDESFVRQAQATQGGSKASLGFSFERFVEVCGFSAEDFALLIAKRLYHAGWKKRFTDFVSPDAFWTLMLGVAGHPRQGLRVLQKTMESTKGKTAITDEDILASLASYGLSIDAIDTAILRPLALGKSVSPSDAAFQKTIGLSRSQLLRRLRELQRRVHLTVTQGRTGKTSKSLYSLPIVDFDAF